MTVSVMPSPQAAVDLTIITGLDIGLVLEPSSI